MGHPALDRMDVGLRRFVHPPLVATMLGCVDRRDVGDLQEVRQRRGGVCDEPIVAVDEVIDMFLGERAPSGEHVVVHLLDPAQEAV